MSDKDNKKSEAGKDWGTGKPIGESTSKRYRILDEKSTTSEVFVPSRSSNNVANSFAPPIEGTSNNNGKSKSDK